MRSKRVLEIGLALAAATQIVAATEARAVAPNVSSSPDTDAFRAAGAAAVIDAQKTAIVSQFQEITRVFRGCTTGGGIVPDGSGCADSVNGRFNDFYIIQGTLRNSNTDPNGLGVPNGPSLGEVTYRLSGNGASNGVACSRDPAVQAPTSVGFLSPEGFDGVPNTADDAGGTGAFGIPGPGINPNSTAQAAAPLVNCQGKTKLEQAETVAGTTNTFLTATNGELCVVSFDLNSNGSIANENNGVGAPGAVTTIGGVAGNETPNLRLSCDVGITGPPPGDFLPPLVAQRSQDIVGGQIYKVAASRDVHTIGNNDTKLHLADAQLEAIFGNPVNNSVCRLDHVGAASTTSSQNVTACIRQAGAGVRESLRLSFMANTAGSKVQSEDPSGLENGTTATCIQSKEGGGSQVSTKRIKATTIISEQINCLATFSGAFTYIDANRFDPAIYGVVVEGVDPDAAILAPPSSNLKQLVKCGQYRDWLPVSTGIGAHNPAGSAFITAHNAALKSKPVLYATSNSWLPVSTIGFNKNASDGAYSIAFVPASCPGAPPAEIPISATPNAEP
jgi:hypothetical protein